MQFHQLVYNPAFAISHFEVLASNLTIGIKYYAFWFIRGREEPANLHRIGEGGVA